MRVTERFLLVTAIIIGVCGLLGLFACTRFCELPVTTIAAAGSLPDDALVRVRARVVASRVVNNTTFLTLEEAVQRPAVIFTAVPVPVGARIEATGKVQTYRGEKELIISALRAEASESGQAARPGGTKESPLNS